jgi:NAD(P)-dependent dehydrogenase (short-subunit alcohol dehydrogenase family)
MVNQMDAFPGNGIFPSFTKTWHNKPYAQISPVRPELSAAGKVVFVTGGATGIGLATSIAFAQAGAKTIAIFGRRADKLKLAAEEIRKANTNGTTQVICERVDLSQREAVDAAFTRATNQAGGNKVNVFISNAGVFPAPGPVSTYSEQDFLKGVELNMAGALNAVRAIMPLLEPKATVINVTSAIAHIGPFPGAWLYAATKAANIKMFDYLQAENPELSVFNTQPGVVSTEMNADQGIEGQDERELRFIFKFLGSGGHLSTDHFRQLNFQVNSTSGSPPLRQNSSKGSWCGSIGTWRS